MIGKAGKSRVVAKPDGRSQSRFGDLIKYIAREADGKGREVMAGEMGLLNISTPADELNLAIILMDNAAAKRISKNGLFKGDPAYHLILSWQQGDNPSAKQAEDCVQYTLKALGMNECQAVWAMHRDTDNDHVHIAVNRVHPEKKTVVGPPRRDYHVIDKAMRELEIQHGFARDNGPFITVEGKGGPQIVRMSREERLGKGLLKNGDGQGPRLTQAAKAAERNQGAPSFQEWAQGAPTKFLRDALRPGTCVSWDDLHGTLTHFGMVIQPKGSGMIVSTTLEKGRMLACPLSKLDRNFTRMKLELRLGIFTPAPSIPLPPTTNTYERFLHSQQSGTQPSGPAEYNDKDGHRLQRRVERQADREDLYARYIADQLQIKHTRSNSRQSLMARQKAERDGLQANTKASKQAFIPKEAATGMTRIMAQSLWAYEVARAKEALQKKHLKERHALPRTMVWRDWLEQQTAPPINDGAALAALRGIRYREGRKANREKNGIEGEELEALKPILSTLHHEIDHRHQLIHYKNDRGVRLFTDTGPRIEMHDRADSSVEAALRIAAQKYGAVAITGSTAFREQAVRQAARIGIPVRDQDLQSLWREERLSIQSKVQEVHPEMVMPLVDTTPAPKPAPAVVERVQIPPDQQKWGQEMNKPQIRRKPRRAAPEMGR